MSKAEIIEILGQVEIFNGIPLDLLSQVASSLSEISFNAGESIITKGEQGNSMYVLVSGKVKIHDDQHIVAILEPVNFFGEFSLIDAAPRSMSVTAIENIKLFKIGRDIFYKLLNNETEVAQKIITTLTARLRQQNQDIIKELKSREEELTRLVDERTQELKLKNIEISTKNKEITDNLTYAKQIQAAIMPDINFIYKTLKKAFILYSPKDIVSGDFFSFFIQNGSAIIIAADCTGHGVTGAFLSVIGNSLLNQIINEKKIINPAEILVELNESMIQSLRQRNNESNDGMDISVCVIDFENRQLQFAGANRPLWFFRRNELIIYKPDKFPVGGVQIFHEQGYTNNLISLEDCDTFYIFSDGFADQFGGENGKKLMTGKFKEILIGIQELDMDAQERYLKDFFERWKGENEQVDDVLVIGIRI